MGKIIKEVSLNNKKVSILRYLRNNKFRFTIELIDYNTNEVSEVEYLADSIFEKFEEITMEYNFHVVE